MAADSRLRVKKIDTVTHIEFVDRSILDEANIQKIGEEIARIIETETKPKLLISFANVDHLSSSALSMLIAINSKMKAPKNGELRLANIDPQLYEVFVITRLNKLFKIHPTTEEAMKSLA
jgi:anti-sigma B factor antagonist